MISTPKCPAFPALTPACARSEGGRRTEAWAKGRTMGHGSWDSPWGLFMWMWIFKHGWILNLIFNIYIYIYIFNCYKFKIEIQEGYWVRIPPCQLHWRRLEAILPTRSKLVSRAAGLPRWKLLPFQRYLGTWTWDLLVNGWVQGKKISKAPQIGWFILENPN